MKTNPRSSPSTLVGVGSYPADPPAPQVTSRNRHSDLLRTNSSQNSQKDAGKSGIKSRDALILVVLASLWGGSYLFLRISAGDFGAVTLGALRATGASALLLPLLVRQRGVHDLRVHWKPITAVGLANCALPFVLFSVAASSITAGLAALFSATTPLFTALIGWVWLRDQLTPLRAIGLAIGFAGVLWTVWDKASFQSTGLGLGWAVTACLLATFCYGLAANMTKRYLQRVPPLAISTGSQLSSALALIVPAMVLWPDRIPRANAWMAMAALTMFSTALAYLLFFRLIARIGAPRATTVTLLIPIFGALWGALFLGEAFTLKMSLGAAVVLVGTGITTGLINPTTLFTRLIQARAHRP